MADLSDVEVAFAETIASIIYPSGFVGTWPVSPIVGAPVRVIRGWPLADVLDSDMADGRCQVSVFPMQGMAKNTTRYGLQPLLTPGVPTLTVSVTGQVVTFAGTGGAGQLAGILAGGRFGTPATVRLQAGSTPATVAAALSALIVGSSVSGASVTLPGTIPPIARVNADGQSYIEQLRQDIPIRLYCYAPTPALRDLLCSSIANAFSAGRWMPLADGTSAYIRYRTTYIDDVPSKAAMWRRDLVYQAEYGTGITSTVPCVLFAIVNTNGTQETV